MSSTASATLTVPAPAPDPTRPVEPAFPPLDMTTPQLTVRALLTGGLLGGMLSACNIYAGLSIGWSPNMAMLSILVTYALYAALQRTVGVRPWNMLENNLSQAVSSAAAAVSSAGLVAAIPALTMMNGTQLSWPVLAVWVFSVCLVGIVTAIPLRRQLIEVDRLPFPTGIATAQMLREMYAEGAEAMRRVTALATAGVLAAATKLIYDRPAWVRDGLKALHLEKLALTGTPIWAPEALTRGFSTKALTFTFEPTLLFVGFGGLIGLRAAFWLMAGAITAWLVVAPPLITGGQIPLTVGEPLPALPSGVAEQLARPPANRLSYEPVTHRLIFEGQMSAAERDQLAGLSDDPRYQEAIRKLYARSQLAPLAPQVTAIYQESTTRPAQFSAATAGLPPDVTIPPELSSSLRYNAASRELVHYGRMSAAVRDAALALVDDAARRYDEAERRGGLLRGLGEILGGVRRWLTNRPPVPDQFRAMREAVLDLYDRSQVPLIPADARWPDELVGRLTYDPSAQQFRASAALTEAELQPVLSLQPEGHPRRSDLQASLAAVRSGTNFVSARPNFVDLNRWLLWPGVTLMVVASLVSFSFSAPAMMRAFRFRGAAPVDGAPRGDVPTHWRFIGVAAALLLATAVQYIVFGIPVWVGALAVLLTFALALVAARVAGETNVTPVGAMGKITQLAFGVISPNSAATNLMTANVTGGAASQCADLMHDLKAAAVLGAAPRYLAIAQVVGAASGALFGTAFYLAMVPDPKRQLMTEQWPAPAVATWKAVAEIFNVGFSALPEGALLAMSIAAAAGVIFPIIERFVPRSARFFVPSCSAFGLAFIIQAHQAVSMFIGAVLVALLALVAPRWSERFSVPICAGLIAGESIVGAGMALAYVATQ